MDIRTLSGWLDWASNAPVGTRVAVEALIPLLRDALEAEDTAPAMEQASPIELPWPALLWITPAETRLGVHEVCEALGRSSSWLYRHTSAKALKKSRLSPIPHRKLEGELVFLVGELRTWIRDTEESVYGLPMESTEHELKLMSGGGR